jgi:hypothetical protein
MPDTNGNLQPVAQSTPPKGDEAKGEKYVADLIRLLESGKIQVYKTDLSQFNPSSLQSHYRIDLDDFQIEISHSTHLDTGSHSFVIIFNNLKKIADGNTGKAILAYIHLNETQYMRFHKAAELQIDKLQRIEDEKRFLQAVRPFDDKIAQLEQSTHDIFRDKLHAVQAHVEQTHLGTQPNPEPAPASPPPPEPLTQPTPAQYAPATAEKTEEEKQTEDLKSTFWS